MYYPKDLLQTLADKFLSYRGAKRRCAFPEEFWQEAYSLSKLCSVLQIAKAIHLHPVYVKRKFKQLAQSHKPEIPAFAQVQLQPSSPATVTSLDFTMINGNSVSIRFQSDVSALFPLIQALAGI